MNRCARHTLIDFIESTEPTRMEFSDADFDHMRSCCFAASRS